MAQMKFYRFDFDISNPYNSTQAGSTYGYAVANPRDFEQDPSDVVLFLDKNDNEWVAYDGDSELAESEDIDALMQEIASSYGADSYSTDDENDIVTASIIGKEYDPVFASRQSLEYGIDIDPTTMTVTGSRRDVAAWKRSRREAMSKKSAVHWNRIDDDVLELDNGKSDTFISEGRDGNTHLYHEGLDIGAFDDEQMAIDNYESIDVHDYDPDEAFSWPLSVEELEAYGIDDDEDIELDDIDDEADRSSAKSSARTARVWKLDIDRNLTPSEKKTFLDNNVDVNETDENNDTVQLTMTGADDVIADTAELLGLTDDFARDAYSSNKPDTSKQEPENTQEDYEEKKQEDPAKEQILDGLTDMLESWKTDLANKSEERKGNMKRSMIARTEVRAVDVKDLSIIDFDYPDENASIDKYDFNINVSRIDGNTLEVKGDLNDIESWLEAYGIDNLTEVLIDELDNAVIACDVSDGVHDPDPEDIQLMKRRNYNKSRSKSKQDNSDDADYDQLELDLDEGKSVYAEASTAKTAMIQFTSNLIDDDESYAYAYCKDDDCSKKHLLKIEYDYDAEEWVLYVDDDIAFMSPILNEVYVYVSKNGFKYDGDDMPKTASTKTADLSWSPYIHELAFALCGKDDCQAAHCLEISQNMLDNRWELYVDDNAVESADTKESLYKYAEDNFYELNESIDSIRGWD